MSPPCRARWTTYEVLMPEGMVLADLMSASRQVQIIRQKIETFRRGLEHITVELFR